MVYAMPAMVAAQTNSLEANWNAANVLKLDISDLGYAVRCHGITQKGLRCANPIGRDWHNDIRQEIRHVTSIPLFQVTAADLVPLADTLLCKRWHTGAQGPQLARKWKGKLSQCADMKEEKARIIVKEQEIKREDDDEVVEDLERRAAIAEDKAAESLRLLETVTELLKKTQLSVNEQERKAKELKNDNELLKSKLSALTRERDADVQKLQVEMREAHEKAETMAKQLKQTEHQLHGEVSSLQYDLSAKGREMEHQAAQHERQVTQIEQRHADEKADLQSQNSNLNQCLRSSNNEIRKQKETARSLAQEKQAKAVEVTALKETLKQERMKAHFETLKHHFQLRMWQRHADGLRADNETLAQQQGELQRVASGYGQELRTLQVSLISALMLHLFHREENGKGESPLKNYFGGELGTDVTTLSCF